MKTKNLFSALMLSVSLFATGLTFAQKEKR